MHQTAIKTQRTYGTKLHIDDSSHQTTTPKQTEPVDFFQEVATQESIKPVTLAQPSTTLIKEPEIADKSLY